MKTPFNKHLKQFFSIKNIQYKFDNNVYTCYLKDSQYINLPRTFETDIEIFLYKRTNILANAVCTKQNEDLVYLTVNPLIINNNNNNNRKRQRVF